MQERDIFDNESEQRRFHSELITNMAEGVFLVSVDTGMIAYANPKANQMFDYEADTLAGVGMHTLIAPSHLTPVNIAENIKKSGVWKGEILCAKRSGLHFWCSILFSTFEHTKYGASWIAMCRDISERKRAVAELDTFFTLARDMLCIADESGYFKRVNPMFSKILGYTEWELTHRPFVEFVHPDDRQKTLDELVKLSKGIPSINFENRYVCKDGV
ncbi:MAG: PAS domain-containing protein [Candidatus Magnetominusculus sp. LBB02]|nr:PAS domain-containing protein [Candidatus Magnetominusculus sp. LBB02]